MPTREKEGAPRDRQDEHGRESFPEKGTPTREVDQPDARAVNKEMRQDSKTKHKL
jgi:hypothetical protein